MQGQEICLSRTTAVEVLDPLWICPWIHPCTCPWTRPASAPAPALHLSLDLPCTHP